MQFFIDILGLYSLNLASVFNSAAIMNERSTKCVKVAFENRKIARKRAEEINAEKEVRASGFKFSAYLCPLCLKYHLSKMDRTLARWINDIAYRNKVREDAFVARETRYYNKRHNIRE